MNEEPLQPEPGPSPDPAENGPEPARPAPEPEKTWGTDPKPRRLLVKALILLYACSLAAAGALILRSKSGARASNGKDGLSVSKALLSGGKEYVGVVSIKGAIYAGEEASVFTRGPRSWRRSIEKLAAKKEVRAIVVSVNSPGGSVGAVQEIHSTIERMRGKYKKPFVAQFGDIAASGGYYVGAACDKIVAHPGTLLGSIGVIFSMSNIEGLLKKIGVTTRPIKSGKMKDIGSMTRPMTPEEKRLLQGLIDNAYGQFFRAVADGRGLDEEALRPLADGRIFTGEQGLELGLVDELGGFRDAVALAGKLGKIKGEPKVFRESESLASMLELLESRFGMSASPHQVLLSGLREFTYTGLEYRWARP